MNNESEQIFLVNHSVNQTSNDTEQTDEMAETTQVNLENIEDFSNVCRTCATITEFVIPIFEEEGQQNTLADKIHKHLPIQVTEQDLLPRVVCYQCASTLLAWHELVQCCVQADAALKTRAAALEVEKQKRKSADVANQESTEDKEQVKFKEIADFVVQSMEPPQYTNSSTSPVIEPSRTCEYCVTEQVSHAYKDHLIDAHSDLLFHCDECDEYVDRKDFILHMSLHAEQYAANQDKKSDSIKTAKKVKKRKDEERDENSNNDHLPILDETVEEQMSINSENHEETLVITREQQNEFSDHDDAEFGFGPLPESVFDAIEDSQESQTGESVARSQTSDVPDYGSNEPEKTFSSASVTEKKTQKKTRTCPICGKVYSASSSYFYHMKYFHRRCKEHECEVCGRKFGTKGGLAEHATIHTGECKLECKTCGKKFRSKASLYIHEQSHDGVKSWSCTQCGKSFRWRTHLARHGARHAAERPHVCVHCGRGFAVHCDLLRHARTHTSAQHTCEKCGIKFAQLRYLKVHMDKKHNAQTVQLSDNTDVTNAVSN